MNYSFLIWLFRSLLFGAGFGIIAGKVMHSASIGITIGIGSAVLIAVVWRAKREETASKEQKQLFVLLAILGIIVGLAGLITFLLISE